jgi:phospholipid transport system substrate-binding protein
VRNGKLAEFVSKTLTMGHAAIERRSARRRWLVASLALAAAFTIPCGAAEPKTDPASARIRVFYDALLDAMKHAKELGVQGRYDRLAPVIRSTFDLAAMTRIAVGPGWTSIPVEQQTALAENFARMTIATYANRFDGYAGERFEVEPAAEPRNADRIVHTRLLPSDGEPVTLNYLMRGSGNAWKIVDVYLSGTISELATRRSEFGAILKSGGPKALIDALRERGDRLLKTA